MAALEESLMMVSSPKEDDGFHQIPTFLSRLAICTNSDHPNLSVFTPESIYDGAEADGEVSDDDKGGGGERKDSNTCSESDSDKEIKPGFYSLPVTPFRRRRKSQVFSELDANDSDRKCELRRQRRETREKKKRESEGGEGLKVLTRANGGEKSFRRRGLDEVKACKDLGFELENPRRISVSTGSNFDTQTSSGSNSPIATWRISSPGDDPKDVKARLKLWAQAVALASASRNSS